MAKLAEILSFAHIFGALKPISLNFSLTLCPLVSNRQLLAYPPPPLGQQSSAFGLPPPPPPAADVICGQPLTKQQKQVTRKQCSKAAVAVVMYKGSSMLARQSIVINKVGKS